MASVTSIGTNSYPIYIVLNDEFGIDERVLEAFDLPLDGSVSYQALLGKKMVSPNYNDYYVKDTTSMPGKTVFDINPDLSTAFNQGMTLEVKAVLAPKVENVFSIGDGVYHLNNFNEVLLTNASTSEIGIQQQVSNYYVANLQGMLTKGINLQMKQKKDRLSKVF